VNLKEYIDSMSKQVEPRHSGKSKEKSSKSRISIVDECTKHNRICGVSMSVYHTSPKKREKIPIWNMLEVKGPTALQKIVRGCTALVVIK